MRTWVFIDGHNFDHRLEERGLLPCTWCNFAKLATLLKKQNDIISRILYFTTEVSERFIADANGEVAAQQFWLAAVKTVIPEKDIYYGKYIRPNKRRVEKMTDTHITMQLLLNMNQFDKVIVISGDMDFWPVYKYLKENGKEVWVYSPDKPKSTKYHERYILEDYCRKRNITFHLLDDKVLRDARFNDIVRDAEGIAVAQCEERQKLPVTTIKKFNKKRIPPTGRILFQPLKLQKKKTSAC
ncbi:MAG: NYN domain-containing protein [Bacteroidota bacterium]